MSGPETNLNETGHDKAGAEQRRSLATVSGSTMLTDSAKFEHTWRVAKVFAGSQLIPAHLRGKVEDVMIALHIAERLKDDPLTVLQSIYLVSGKAGWLSSYMVARINQSGIIKGRITWTEEGEGQDLAVTARATLAVTGEEVTATATMRMAIGEQWVKNAKYQTMPAHMLRWRAASMLMRLYFPEVMLGIPTAEELEDQPAPLRDMTPKADEGRPGAALQLEQFAAAGPQTAKVEPEQPKAPRKKRTPRVEPTSPPVAAGTEPSRPETAEERALYLDEAIPAPVFDADLYLKQIIVQLDDITLEELDSAHGVVKEILSKHPNHLALWNAARLEREMLLRKQREAMA